MMIIKSAICAESKMFDFQVNSFSLTLSLV